MPGTINVPQRSLDYRRRRARRCRRSFGKDYEHCFPRCQIQRYRRASVGFDGFLTNLISCLILLSRNRTGYLFFNPRIRTNEHQAEAIIETAFDAPSREVVEHIGSRSQTLTASAVTEKVAAVQAEVGAPMLRNYLPCALAATTWYFPVFLLHHGQEPDGLVQIFQLNAAHGQHHHLQQPVGNRLQRMETAGTRAGLLLTLALLLLVGSTVIVGYGNYLALPRSGHWRVTFLSD